MTERRDGSGVCLRPARLDDAAQILALEAVFPTDRISRRSLRRLLASPSADLWVAEVEGQVAGTLVLLSRRGSSWLRIYSVAVDARWRGRGIGEALIRQAEHRAQQQHCRGISLEVRVDNGPARRLYQRLGYSEVAVREGYYEDGESAVRMRKVLETPGA